MPAWSVARAMAPPKASISFTRWLLPMPPMAGLQDICPRVSMLWVSSRVCEPMRAAANAASVPAWPPPMTMTSKRVGNSTLHLGNRGKKQGGEYNASPGKLQSECANFNQNFGYPKAARWGNRVQLGFGDRF